MDTVRILIADNNESFRENLAELLRARYTVRTCTNGICAADLLKSFDPDFLVLDLMLPNADVFALIESAVGLSAGVYVFSAFLSVPIQERLLTAGIYGMMSKNCDIYNAEYNIRAMVQRHPRVRRQRDNRELTSLLLRMGFQPHRDGYKQLLMAIPMYMADRTLPLQKVIYAEIAAHMGLEDPRCVERSIRDSIKDYCDLGDRELWTRLFPPKSRGKAGYPSNKTFIARISEHLRLGGDAE